MGRGCRNHKMWVCSCLFRSRCGHVGQGSAPKLPPEHADGPRRVGPLEKPVQAGTLEPGSRATEPVMAGGRWAGVGVLVPALKQSACACGTPFEEPAERRPRAQWLSWSLSTRVDPGGFSTEPRAEAATRDSGQSPSERLIRRSSLFSRGLIASSLFLQVFPEDSA